jgi:hypothetical protein
MLICEWQRLEAWLFFERWNPAKQVTTQDQSEHKEISVKVRDGAVLFVSGACITLGAYAQKQQQAKP